MGTNEDAAASLNKAEVSTHYALALRDGSLVGVKFSTHEQAKACRDAMHLPTGEIVILCITASQSTRVVHE